MKMSVILVLFSLFNLVSIAHAESPHFTNPKWNGYDLDWCKDFEQDCGAPAADAFCEYNGFLNATAFVMAPAVKVSTMTIGQNAICNPADHRCDSFASIDCKVKDQTFQNPTFRGYRLDWCREFDQDCGAPAALAFCQHFGFTDLVDFQKQPQVNVSTMVISSGAICDPKFHGCDTFTHIECRNN